MLHLLLSEVNNSYLCKCVFLAVFFKLLLLFQYKMPRVKPTHDDYCKKVCLLCFSKTKTMYNLTEIHRNTIETHIKPGLSATDHALPTVLCQSCYNAVNERQRNIFDRHIPLFNHSTLNGLRPITRTSPDCDCRVCEVGRDKLHYQHNSKPSVGRPAIKHSEETTTEKKCSFCLTSIGKGKPHVCSKGTRYDNLRKIIDNPDDISGEVIAANVLKSKTQQMDTDGPCVSLKQKGRPLRVHVSPPSDKENVQVSHEDLLMIKRDRNYSVRGLTQLTTELRSATRRRLLIAPGLRESMHLRMHRLDDIFEVCTGSFEDRTKPIVFCSSIGSLIERVIQERDLTFQRLHFKIGLDSGGDFMKVCMNVIRSDQQEEDSVQKRRRYSDGVCPKSQKDTSVNRLLILAITPEKKETYDNIKITLDLLERCKELDDYGRVTLAADLKMANIIVGLMPHSCRHPCTWCDIDK